MGRFTLGALTCTGGRPDAFNLCRKWVAHQTRQPDQWVIVDDVEEELPTTSKETVIRPEPFWTPGGEPTLRRNMLAGLKAIDTDIIVIVEDDDYYDPFWFEYVESMFEDWFDRGFRLVGEAPTTYYNVNVLRCRTCANMHHASLCATALHQDVLGEITQIIDGCESNFLDIPMWEVFYGQGYLDQTKYILGMKGLPGRHGIGSGHDWSLVAQGSDPLLEQLKWFMGNDYKYYLPFMNFSVMAGLLGMKPKVEKSVDTSPSIANPPNEIEAWKKATERLAQRA